MSKLNLFLVFLFSVKLTLYSQNFIFSSKSSITDGKQETFSEIASDKEIELNFETKGSEYEGIPNQIIVKFRSDTDHPLPEKISLAIVYEMERFSSELGYHTVEVTYLDTLIKVEGEKIIFNYWSSADGDYLRKGKLKINFMSKAKTKYLIEDVFITGKDFRIYEQEDEKPVIYLYPSQPTDVTIQHLNAHQFTFSYPKYEKEWKFKAFPNGDIENEQGKRFPYLFWEGLSKLKTSFKMGYCVKKDSIVAFLEDKLAYQGLNYKEITDFITYWGPRMQHSPYYLIYFANQEFEQEYPVKIFPVPDTELRVFMVAKPSSYFVKMKEQPLSKKERKGFSYIEWGGKLLE